MSARLVAWLAVLAGCLVAAPAASAQGPQWPFGERYGFADPSPELLGGGVAPAAAFGGNPEDEAFFAGTCDLADGVIDAGGVGVAPGPGDDGFPLAHCVDHGRQFNPPLPDVDGVFAEDSGPAGWWTGDNPTAPVSEEGPSWLLDPVAAAGAHPDASTSFWFRRNPRQIVATIVPDGDTRDVVVRLPAGVVGNPQAIGMCPAGENLRRVPVVCPPESQVGIVTVNLSGTNHYAVPVYNVEPRDGKTAEFILSAGVGAFDSNVPIVARARTDGDFGVDAMALQIPAGFPLLGQTVTLWGVPWAAEHDRFRVPAGYGGSSEGSGVGMPLDGLDGSPGQEPQPYERSWGPVRPFFSNPTECAPDAPVTLIDVEMWQAPHTTAHSSFIAPPVDRCADVPFHPQLSLAATSAVADGPTGLDVDLALAHNDDPPFSVPPVTATQAEIDQYVADAADHWRSPAGRAASHLRDTVVTLPAGVSVNPAGARGLVGCTDGQLGVTDPDRTPPLFNNADPFDGQGAECPAGSVLGTVEAHTPLLAETLTGQVVLGQPKPVDIRGPGEPLTFRVFLVVRNRERGLVAKIFGTASADPANGQLTATFAQNPRLPLERVQVRFGGGQRAQLANPQRCAAHGWTGLLTPWSAAHGAGGTPVQDGGAFTTNARCAFGFAPAIAGGSTPRTAGRSARFELAIVRSDGEQWLRGATVRLPLGLLAKVRGVPLCTAAQAAAAAAGTGECPAGSRIGTVDAAAGSGAPFVLDRKGDVYLTEGYKGAPYGLLTRVPVEAGPFRGALALEPIVVRQALHVDRTTAQATAISDPFPHIWHGIPLRARQITITIDRPDFTRNPTDCAPTQIEATLHSTAGAAANAAQPFRAAGCRGLTFNPRLRMRLVGRRHTRTGGHPSLRALVRQRPGQAAIERAQVRLPRSLALDPDNARALCEFVDGTRPDPENHCPRGSIVGRARATSPLLNRPLTGPVFFVKNVRIDPDTGNEIRTLPMIVVALRGEIAINLRGQSSTTRRGHLVNTFTDVPDAPVRRFALRIKGGRNGILVVTRTRRGLIDICRRPQRAQADLDAHNNRRADQTTPIKTPCPKSKSKRKSKRRRR